MDKVYVVTAGLYDEYRVVAVCANEEVAREMINSGYGDAYDEYPLDAVMPILYTHKCILDLLTGKLVDVARVEPQRDPDPVVLVRYFICANIDDKVARPAIFAYGINEEAAIKAAKDYRTSLIALGKYRSNPAPNTLDDFYDGCRVSFYTVLGEQKFGQLRFLSVGVGGVLDGYKPTSYSLVVQLQPDGEDAFEIANYWIDKRFPKPHPVRDESDRVFHITPVKENDDQKDQSSDCE